MANNTQSEEYKYLNIVDRVGDLPGANRESDTLEMVSVETLDANITADATRTLGIVSLDADQIPLSVDLSSHSAGVLPVEPQTPVAIEDSTGTLVDPATDTTLTNTLAREIANWTAGTLPVEQQTPAGIEDTTGTQIDPATETTLSALAAALASNAGDTLQVAQQGVVDVSSRDGRNLGDVDVTALPDHDEAFHNDTALASGGSLSDSLAAPGAERLEGRVSRATTSYDVTIEWLDAAGGNVLFTTSVATGVAAGTETSISEAAQSPYCNVVVADAGAGSGAVTATYNLA